MKILLLVALFNIHTGNRHDVEVASSFDTPEACVEALIAKGARKPNEDGDVQIYECAVPPAVPTGQSINF